MKVIVDDVVVKEIDSFYSAAMSRHITLSEETVMAKKKRLIEALESLSDYYFIYPKARLIRKWIENNWQELLVSAKSFVRVRMREAAKIRAELYP